MAHFFGFPPGYFVIRSVATGRPWDVCSDEVEDGTPVILWLEKEQSLVEGRLSRPDIIPSVHELMHLTRLEKTRSE